MKSTIAGLIGLVLLFSLAGVSSLAHAGENKFLSVEDILEFETASDPQLSPDAHRIIYVRDFVDAMADQRRSNIWMVDADGANERALTTGNFSDNSPRWLPDGKSFVYISDRDGAPQIYRFWIDTSASVRLTHLSNSPSNITVSPDGKLIAFAALVPDPARTIKGMPKPPTGATWASAPQIIDKSVYRFNGAGYLKAGYTHLFTVPTSGGTARQISSGNFDHGGPGLNPRGAVAQWGPESRTLYIAVNRRADADSNQLDTEVFEYSLDGAVKQLTDRRGPDNAPIVSPDGKWLAYLGFDDRYQGYQVTHLYLMARDGTGRRELTREFDRDVVAARFSSDSRGVYLLSQDQGDTGLYYLPLTGGMPKLLAAHVATGLNAGGGAPTIDVRGKVVATVIGAPNRPGDVAIIDSKGNSKWVSDTNGDLLGQRTLGQVEEVRYKSSKDGREIEGWLIKPPNFDPSKKYPR